MSNRPTDEGSKPDFGSIANLDDTGLMKAIRRLWDKEREKIAMWLHAIRHVESEAKFRVATALVTFLLGQCRAKDKTEAGQAFTTLVSFAIFASEADLTKLRAKLPDQ